MTLIRILLTTLVTLFCLPPLAHAETAFYEIETLNTGLPPAPDRVQRRSPQAAMESLFDLVAQDDPASAHLLNLNALSPEQQAEDGAALAKKLVTVLNRKVVLDWSGLLERPDALNANETNKSAVAGQPRRSILLGTLDGPRRPVGLRIERFKPEGEAPVWLISPESVANIPALHALYGPSAFEQSLPEVLRKQAFWHLYWWEILALPLMLIGASVAGFAAHRLLTRLAAHRAGTFGAGALRSARVPLVIATVALVVAGARRIFVFSGLVDQIIGPAITLGLVVSVLMLVINVVDELLTYVSPREDGNLSKQGREDARSLATNISVARRIVILIVFIAGMGVVLSQANLFATVGFSLLASAGVITLVLGFAAREILGNILSSLQIAMNHSARIGDKVFFDGKVCTVERINFTFVQLRVWTGVRLIVPVRQFVSEHFENWSVQEAEMVRLVELHLAHDAPVPRLRDAFETVLDEIDPEELDDRSKSQTLVTGQDVFGKSVTFCVACANPNTAWEVSCRVREGLLDQIAKMEANGARIFPQAYPAEAV